MSARFEHLRRLANEEVEATLAELPPALREEATRLPITFERRPSTDLQADGIAEDTLGLFVGPEFAEEGHVPMPSQIILFLDNLWDFSEDDEATFLDEVHTTLLHELGHFLGLNEDDLYDRGLE